MRPRSGFSSGSRRTPHVLLLSAIRTAAFDQTPPPSNLTGVTIIMGLTNAHSPPDLDPAPRKKVESNGHEEQQTGEQVTEPRFPRP